MPLATTKQLENDITEICREAIAAPAAETIAALSAYVGHLLNTHDLWSPEGLYAFPDGEVVTKEDFAVTVDEPAPVG